MRVRACVCVCVRPKEGYDAQSTKDASFFLSSFTHPSIHPSIHPPTHFHHPPPPIPIDIYYLPDSGYYTHLRHLAPVRYLTMTSRALAMVHLPPMHGARGVSGYLARHPLHSKTIGLPGTGTWERTFTHTLKRSLCFKAPTSPPSIVPSSSPKFSSESLKNGFNPIKGVGSIILTRGAHQSFAQREVDDVVSFYDDKVTQVSFLFWSPWLPQKTAPPELNFQKWTKYSHPGPPLASLHEV